MMRFQIFAIIILYRICICSDVKFFNDDDNEDDWSMVMEIEVQDPGKNRTQKQNESIGQTRTDDSVEEALGTIYCGKLKCFNWARCYKISDHSNYCLCSIGFSGKFCEEVNDGFRYPKILPGGYLKFQIDRNSNMKTKDHSIDLYLTANPPNKYEIEFSIRTVETNGKRVVTIYKSAISRKFSILLLEDGYLVFRYDHSLLEDFRMIESEWSKVYQELRHPQKITKNEWHSIKIQETEETVSLSLNGHKQEKFDPKTNRWPLEFPVTSSRIYDNKEYIYLGGYPLLNGQSHTNSSHAKYFQLNFVGCIQNIIINGHLKDPRRNAFVGDVLEGYGIDDCSRGICLKSGCKNNGTCKVTSGTTFVCECPLGTHGMTCEAHQKVKLPAYSGYSYTEYNGLKGSSTSFTSLTLVFQPSQPDGLLLYEGFSHDQRGDFMAVYLDHSFIHVAFDLGSGSAHLKCPYAISLGEWHSLRFWRIGRQGYLKLDSKSDVTISYSEGPLVQLTLVQPLFLGGHPNSDLISAYLTKKFSLFHKNQTGFSGCIQAVEINGRSIKLIEDAIRGINIHNCPNHPCSSNPDVCYSQGQCIPDKSAFVCACPLGFSGNRCESRSSVELIQTPLFKGSGYLEFDSKSLGQRFDDPQYHLIMELRPATENFRRISAYFPTKYFSKDEANDDDGLAGRYLLYGIFSNKWQSQHIYLRILHNGRLWIRVEKRTDKHHLDKQQISENTDKAIFDFLNVTKNSNLPFLDQITDTTYSMLLPNVWHTILITKVVSGFTLFVNRTQVASIQTQEKSDDRMNLVKLFIGGISRSLQSSLNFRKLMNQSNYTSTPNVDNFDNGFIGCIQKLEINGQKLPVNKARSGFNVDQCFIDN